MPEDKKPLKREFHVDDGNAGQRLDLFLRDALSDRSRGSIKRAIDSGGVYVNKKRVLIASSLLLPGDHIELYESRNGKKPEFKKSDIIYEDDHLIAINKYAGVPTQATYSSIRGTVLDILEKYYKNIGRDQYIRLIHRLDKGTTGVLLLSKNPESNRLLSAQFREKSVEKEYLAIVSGVMKEKKGTVETNIAKARRNRSKYENVESGGKKAISDYALERKLKGHMLVSVRPRTGRTHQIRLHMAHIGHPILGDELYGGETRLLFKTGDKLHDINLTRVMLHARSLTLTHPVTKKKLKLNAKVPADMKEIIELLA